MTKPRKVHWKKPDSVDAMCGRYGSTVEFAINVQEVTCGTCVRRMRETNQNPFEPFDSSEPINITNELESAAPAGYLRALDTVIPGTTGERAEFEPPQSPFRVLEDVTLTGRPVEDLGYLEFLSMAYPDAGERLLRAIFARGRKPRRLEPKPRVQTLTRVERGALGTRTRRRERTKNKVYHNDPNNYHHKLTGR